jgi:GNAT superfamily N-acetyltransferase
MSLDIAPLTGSALHSALDDLARLRIAVFRDFPYLYDGTREYEENYLRLFADGKDGIIVAAREGEAIVGCATGSALVTHHGPLQQPFRAAGYDLDSIFYCGESVLLPTYRGRGLGHAFFDHRERHAKARGYRISAFCAVVRPPDHPARPADYRPLDAFWQKRGYRKAKGLVAHFSWKDVGEREQTPKTMQFWLREL